MAVTEEANFDEAITAEAKTSNKMKIDLQKKLNTKEAQFVPLEVKNNIKRMAMEQVLYAQVVKLPRKDLKFIAANKNKNEAKVKFQGQFARSQSWFDIEFDCIEVNFITHETHLYKETFSDP